MQSSTTRPAEATRHLTRPFTTAVPPVWWGCAGRAIICCMSTQGTPRLAPDADPDVVVRGRCRCSLVRASLTDNGWLLAPVVKRGPRPEAVLQTRPFDTLLMDRRVSEWEDTSPLSVWCRHGVSTPNVAEAVQRWRPRMSVSA